MNPLETLHAELLGEMARQQRVVENAQNRIEILDDVLRRLDRIAEAAPASAVEAPADTGRAPRRDIKGTVLKVVADRSSATGVCVELPDICKGAGILLDAPLTESAAQRAVDALVRDGDLLRRGDGYIPNQPHTEPLAHAAK